MTPVKPWPAVDDLQLSEKALVTAGRDLWHIPAIDRVGLPELRVTDGPSGARGTQFTGDPSVCVPCGSALASTWDRDVVHAIGEVLGDEVRRKGAGVLLAPTVNIHRHPLAGRNFECYSEDPLLTAEMAVAYIEGVQSRGVGCCVKHFVANDQEFERMTISAEVDDRTMREIYLPPFEAAVQRAGAWAVMSAYNRLAGVYCSEHHWLLTELLRDEWGFDGLVMSDWYGTHSPASVSNGLDVEMPGPPQQLGPKLVDLIDDGTIDEAAVERAASKVLQLMERAATASPGDPLADEPSVVVRRAAGRAIVLLTNDGVLPIDAGAVTSIAVLGPKAARPDIQGGGSAHVDPFYEITPLDGIIRRAQQDGAIEVVHEPGVVLTPPQPLGGRDVRVPGDDDPGVLVEFLADLDPGSEPVATTTAPVTRLIWLGKPQAGVPRPYSARVRGDFTPSESGRWSLSLTSAGQSRLLIDDETVIDNFDPQPGESFFGAGSVHVRAEIDLEAGRSYALVVELNAPPQGAVSGIELTARAPERPDALDRAVAAAKDADVAVVVVGTDAPDSEGDDREDMELPAEQVALIAAVADANPRTVVLVNAGSPVTMPWADRAAAVALVWYLGQEMGAGIADVVFGDIDASGRLATTFPRRLEDTPAFPSYPGHDGVAPYDEGLLVGYRHYDAQAVDPQFCFGHGLSYTEFDYGPVSVTDNGVVSVTLDVTNVGGRAGREIVQLYVGAPDPVGGDAARARRELRDFAAVDLQPAETATVRFELTDRAFAHWDVDAHDWRVDPGTYEVLVGSSSRAIHGVVDVHR
jgi:beta-glucosidase